MSTKQNTATIAAKQAKGTPLTLIILYASLETPPPSREHHYTKLNTPHGVVYIRWEAAKAGLMEALDMALPFIGETVLNSIPAPYSA